MNKQKKILEQVKNAIRNPFAWPGGYPVYTVLEDAELLCPDCARQNFKQIAYDTLHNARAGGWTAAGAEVLWEGTEFVCAHCQKPLESAYGDAEESE